MRSFGVWETRGAGGTSMHTATKDYRMAPASHSAAQDPRRNRQAWSVLIVSTLAFTVCFMVWMMFGIIGIPIKKMLDLNATQFGLLTAMPVLTGRWCACRSVSGRTNTVGASSWPC